MVYNGASFVYNYVIRTMCEPFVAQFIFDSGLFENPKGATDNKRDKPAETPSRVRSDDCIFIWLWCTFVPSPEIVSLFPFCDNAIHKI